MHYNIYYLIYVHSLYGVILTLALKTTTSPQVACIKLNNQLHTIIIIIIQEVLGTGVCVCVYD